MRISAECYLMSTYFSSTIGSTASHSSSHFLLFTACLCSCAMLWSHSAALLIFICYLVFFTGAPCKLLTKHRYLQKHSANGDLSYRFLYPEMGAAPLFWQRSPRLPSLSQTHHPIPASFTGSTSPRSYFRLGHFMLRCCTEKSITAYQKIKMQNHGSRKKKN